MHRSAHHLPHDGERHGGAGGDTLVDRARFVVTKVNEETRAHPFRTMGWAASAGFVLAGGLFTPLTGKSLRAALHLALRLAVLPALTRSLAQLGANFIDDSNGYGTTTEAEDKT